MAAERVEVSGWDGEENFFVENVWMEPEPDGYASITLHSAPRKGSLVFLRFFKASGEPASSLTIPWRVEEIRQATTPGLYRIWISHRLPARSFRTGA